MNKKWRPADIRRMVRRDGEAAVQRVLWPTVGMVALYGLLQIPFSYVLYGKGYLLEWRGTVFSILQLLLLGPYILGMRRWYLRLVRGLPVRFREVFYYYRPVRYSTALIVVGFFQLVEFILTLVCVYMVIMASLMVCCYMGIFWSFELIPYFLRMGILQQLELFGSPGEFMVFVAVVAMLTVALLLIRFGVKIFLVHYTCAYNLCVDYENWSLSALFAKSRSVMRGTTIDMAKLYISFIPWAVPIVLTGGLALLYVLPVFYCAETLYLEYFRDCYQKNKSIYMT